MSDRPLPLCMATLVQKLTGYPIFLGGHHGLHHTVSVPIAVTHTAGAMSLLWTALWADNGVAHTQEFACPTTPSTLTSPPPLSVPLR